MCRYLLQFVACRIASALPRKVKPRGANRSKIIEVQLHQAGELLLQPKRFKLKCRTLENYERDLRLENLEAAMNKLEALASEYGARSGFWRRLKKVAQTLGRDAKVEE